MLLDNASIHDRAEVERIVGALGGHVRFLPPYAFKLTPLDNGAFGMVVRWLQQHFEELSQMVNDNDIRHALDEGFTHAVDPSGARRCDGARPSTQRARACARAHSAPCHARRCMGYRGWSGPFDSPSYSY